MMTWLYSAINCIIILLLCIKDYMAVRKIKIDATGVPNRIRTGIGNTTILFPHDAFYGKPDSFNWSSSIMRNYYNILTTIFERNGITNVVIGASHVRVSGRKSPKLSFILLAGTDNETKFIWQKYESEAAGSGQNNIFADGKKIAMTSFIKMSPDQQDELVEPVELRRILRAQGFV